MFNLKSSYATAIQKIFKINKNIFGHNRCEKQCKEQGDMSINHPSGQARAASFTSEPYIPLRVQPPAGSTTLHRKSNSRNLLIKFDLLIIKFTYLNRLLYGF